ncbi:MAG: phosphoribosyltransferase [Candidatus Bathyarchaeum sp.]|nr:MAG: phosphoribosyltransferase [Candidatus Bathyarchaeum sp.]
MDWSLFYKLAKQVAKKINGSGYKPDIIVGLARGGWVLARVLCDFVGVKDLVSLKVEHWGVTATPDGTAKLKHPLNVDLTGKKVLVVDDLTDTGESMQVAVEYINSLKPSEVRTATLQHITSAKFKADYIGEEITWVWVVFPWNFTEDMCTIVPKVCARLNMSPDCDVDVTRIRDELKQFYTVDITEEAVTDILQEIKRRNRIQAKTKK